MSFIAIAWLSASLYLVGRKTGAASIFDHLANFAAPIAAIRGIFRRKNAKVKLVEDKE